MMSQSKINEVIRYLVEELLLSATTVTGTVDMDPRVINHCKIELQLSFPVENLDAIANGQDNELFEIAGKSETLRQFLTLNSEENEEDDRTGREQTFT